MMHSEPGATALWLMVLLGAYHGINPAMGWLFAVALGMQQQKRSAVGKALIPIALGHALAIGLVVVTAAFLGMVVPREIIVYSVAAFLVGLGTYSLVGHWHPRWVRMQVGFRDLTAWSFLMASAHGAGLMVLPVLLNSSTVQAANQMAGRHATAASPQAAILATLVHTAAYLAVTGILAWAVYSKFGLAFLRKAWFNFNVIWGAALLTAGLFTLFA